MKTQKHFSPPPPPPQELLNKLPFALLLCSLLLFPDAAFAQLNTVSSTLNTVLGALRALSIVTVTLAVLYVGYKVLFGGQTFRELTPVIIGALVIAGSSEIARLLLGQ
jgi:type IV secretion system protein VirB2